MERFQRFGPLVSRLLFALLFIYMAVGQIMDSSGTEDYLRLYGFPAANVFMIVVIFVELAGSLLLILGYKTRWSAGILALFLLATNFVFHLNFSNPAETMKFIKNLAIIGGLISLWRYGGGPFSIDCRIPRLNLNKKPKKVLKEEKKGKKKKKK